MPLHHLHKERLALNEIRLLTLYPDDFPSQILCTIGRVNLDDRPVYNALSYVWGDPAEAQFIDVNTVQITTTANLASALRHLRHPSEKLVLWVDAICINQEDNDERNAQVKMMGMIYSAATTVFLWIGKADENSDEAFRCMSDVSDGKSDQQAKRVSGNFYLSLSSRPWFGRVWILQEMALASEDPIVVCGTKSASWSLFMATWTAIATDLFPEIGMARPRAIETAHSDGQGETVEVLAKLKIDVLNNLRSAVRQNGGESLRQLLLTSRTSQSTDPRDKIYGLLGMLSSRDRTSFFPIDYGKPVTRVYAEALAHIFAKGDGPFFLSGMWLAGLEPAISGLPSWVPDFSAQTAELAIGFSCIIFHPAFPHTVSGPGAAAVNGVVQEDLQTLKVEVLPVDVITEVIYLAADFQQCLAQLVDIEALVKKARGRHTAHESLGHVFGKLTQTEPLWRILISDKAILSGYDAAPDVYAAMYDELLKYCHNLDTQNSGVEVSAAPSSEYVDALRYHLPGRAFFATSKGFVGLGGPATRPDDEVTIWFGAKIPFIMRDSLEFSGYCQLVSGAYVGGIMKGEMVDQLYCEDLLDSKTLFVR